MKPFFVYLLECADGSYYVGHTDDLARRMAQHDAGEIEGYTHERRPVRLMWSQETATREEALAAEMRIKGWSRVKKQALIAGDWERVSELARSGAQAVRDGLRQAQPERERAVRPEPVDGPERGIPGLRQAQPERGRTVHLEPVEGRAPASTPVRPELVEGPARTAVLTEADQQLIEGLRARNRRALAKTITLLESTRADHRARADALLNALLPETGKAIRLGISGVPGVGKSTFIEALGLHLIAQGHRVAVLAIDPSSSVSGGSILGDKTRMEQLSVHEAAYIRPSPAAGTLGGVAEKTREALLVCEAAGYDVVIVETVGVGQSETAVAGMTDLFVLLQLPNAGDDLQAIKKGVMELADLVVINKADIDPNAATRAQAQITSALRVFNFHGNPAHAGDRWQPQVMQISALKAQGIADFWAAVKDFEARRRARGDFEARRRHQAMAWMWDMVHAGLRHAFDRHPAVRAALPQTLADVDEARIAPSAAARSLLNLFQNPIP